MNEVPSVSSINLAGDRQTEKKRRRIQMFSFKVGGLMQSQQMMRSKPCPRLKLQVDLLKVVM